ncbi:diguanylate cyclase [Pseudoalteromonas sp. 68 DY56-GL68]|uniref:GGDEF domain-containing response regulator n=1 Tax=Pseudoalteromonas sp. 68 DY56-GL68 TaxID=2974919 RepID=UPI00352A5613
MPLSLKPLSQCKVFIVDDDEMVRLSLGVILEDHFSVDAYSSGQAVLEACEDLLPDLILLDINLPDISGLDICRRLKAKPTFENIPIIFITSTYDTEYQNACWEAGASDFIGKPITASTLIHRTKNHLENKLRLEKLLQLTYKDSLTGLFNRHYLDLEVANVFKQTSRERKPFSLLMLDIDFFKLYNDQYGHPQGDACLKIIADVIERSIQRPQDIAIRYGGEEFLVILPFTDFDGVKFICDRISAELEAINIPHVKSLWGRATVSIGGVIYEHQNKVSFNELINCADKALYAAKNDGRNCFRLSFCD